MNPVKLPGHQSSGNVTQNDDKELKSHVLDNFKTLVLNVAMKSSKNKSFVGSQTPILEKRLDELLPCLSTPNHPPYSTMIEKAIQKLDGQFQGSSKEAISTFIKKTYGGLPFFHDELLKNHLVELCKKGDIVQNNDGSYCSVGSKTKRRTILSSISKFSISRKPENIRGFDEQTMVSSSNPCNNKKRTMEVSMEAKKKGKGEEKPIVGRTRSSIKTLGPSSK